MPFVTSGSRRTGRIAALATSLGLLALAPAAQAATTAANPQSCTPKPALSQPFTPWGDRGNYTLSPGGNMERSLTGWNLASGAHVVAGSESFHVGGAADAASLSLPAGSSVVSAPICIDDTYPWFRLFARNTGDQKAGLKVEILYLDTHGKLQTRASGNYSATGSAWAPTGTMKIAMTFDTSVAGGAAPVAFRLTPQGARANWQIDDLYVDPMARR
jgi:hypothetical protein